MRSLIAIPTAPVLNYEQHEKVWKITDWEKANRKWEGPLGRINGPNLRHQAVRETWWKHVPEPDVVARFFVGRTLDPAGQLIGQTVGGDTVILDCEDGYRNLIDKIRGICKWALEHDFDQMLKVDDDSFIHPGMFEFLQSNRDEVVSHVWDFNNGLYALSGGPGYLLNRRVMQAVVDMPRTAFPHCNEMEDHWVSCVVQSLGIKPISMLGFVEEINITVPNRLSFHPVSPKGQYQMYKEFYTDAGL